MEQRTVVAVFNDAATAQRVASELENFGLSRGQIDIRSNSNAPTTHESSFTHWLKNLFGTEDHASYSRAYETGNTILAVRVSNSEEDRVVDILDRYQPVNMREQSSSAAVVANTPAPEYTPRSGVRVLPYSTNATPTQSSQLGDNRPATVADLNAAVNRIAELISNSPDYSRRTVLEPTNPPAKFQRTNILQSEPATKAVK